MPRPSHFSRATEHVCEKIGQSAALRRHPDHGKTESAGKTLSNP
jgi:hypothetical protein